MTAQMHEVASYFLTAWYESTYMRWVEMMTNHVTLNGVISENVPSKTFLRVDDDLPATPSLNWTDKYLEQNISNSRHYFKQVAAPQQTVNCLHNLSHIYVYCIPEYFDPLLLSKPESFFKTKV